MAEDEGKTGFSAGETTLLITIMQNLTGEIQFDAEAVAAKLGYKDGSIVRVRWCQIKKKKINTGAAATAGSPRGIKKRTSKKSAKGTAAAADGEAGDDEEDEVPDTPIKTPAKRGRKPKAKKEESPGEEGYGEREGEAKAKVNGEEEEEF